MNINSIQHFDLALAVALFITPISYFLGKTKTPQTIVLIATLLTFIPSITLFFISILALKKNILFQKNEHHNLDQKEWLID